MWRIKNVCGSKDVKIEKRKERKKEQLNMYIRFMNEKNRVPLNEEFKEFCRDNNVGHDFRQTFGNFTKLKEEVKIENK